MEQARPSERTCTRCGESKPLDAFGKERRGRFGRRSRCKRCEVERVGEYYRANWEKIAEYREANRERAAKRRAIWLRDRMAEVAARYQAEGPYPVPEELLAREVTYRSAHARVCHFYGRASSHTCAGTGCESAADEWALIRSKGEHVRWEFVPDKRGPSPSPRDVAYSLNPQDYRPLCRSCHSRLDRFGQNVVVSLREYEPPTLTEIHPEPQWSDLWYSTPPAHSSQAGVQTFGRAR